MGLLKRIKRQEKALTIAYTGEPEIKTKIEDTEAKIAELKKAQKELKAEGLEKVEIRAMHVKSLGKRLNIIHLHRKFIRRQSCCRRF